MHASPSDAAAQLAERVLLIGWDAADWGVIDPLIAAGRMPHLAKLISTGVRGTIAAPRPLLSPMLWTSIATGKRPWRHGVHGHTEPRPSTWGARPVGSYSWACKSVWELLGESGLRCHAIGWPATHPVRPTDGIAVSDRLPALAAGVADLVNFLRAIQPSTEATRLNKLLVASNQIDSASLREFVPENADSADPVVREARTACSRILAEAATLHALATAVIESPPWDFAAVVYPGIERFSHGFMAYHPPSRDGVAPRAFDLFHGVVARAYELHDMMLGRLLELAGSETTVLLVSDHGFLHDYLRPSPGKKIRHSPESLSAWHRPQGIAVAAGRGIRAGSGKVVTACTVNDIAPTVLALFGLPFASDMDGQPWSAALDERAMPDRVLSSDGAAFQKSEELDDVELYANEAAAHLTALGYREPPDTEFAAQAETAALANAMNLATSLIDVRKPAEALRVLDAFSDSQATSTDLQRLRAEALFHSGHDDEARRIMEELLERGVDTPLAHVGLGLLELSSGRPETALQHFQAAGQKNPDLPGLHTLLAKVYVTLSRWPDAENALIAAIQTDPADADARAMLAGVRNAQDRPHDAEELAARAVMLRPDLPSGHYQLGRALVTMKRVAEACEALTSCLALDAEHFGAHRLLAELFQGPLLDTTLARRHAMQVQEIQLWRRSRGRRDDFDFDL